MLQWGRGCSAAECRESPPRSFMFDGASMGPRLFSRGMQSNSDRTTPGIRASMGPRLFSRGMSIMAAPD